MSPLRSSSVSVVLIFNDSLITLVPSAPIWLSVSLQYLHLHFIFPSFGFPFFLYLPLSFGFSFCPYISLPRSSLVSVVLIFNDSLIILAPSDPIWLSVPITSFKFCHSFGFSLRFSSLSLYITSQIQFSDCRIPHFVKSDSCAYQFKFSIFDIVPFSTITITLAPFLSFSLSLFLPAFLFFSFCLYMPPSRFSSVSVVLIFNDSLIILAPSAPI